MTALRVAALFVVASLAPAGALAQEAGSKPEEAATSAKPKKASKKKNAEKKADEAKTDAKADDAKAGDAKAGDAKADDAKAGDAKAETTKAKGAKAKGAKAKGAKAKGAQAGDAQADDAQADDAVPPGGEEPTGPLPTDAAAATPDPAAGGAPAGADENPEAPVTDFDRPPEIETEVNPPAVTDEYPIERALRPITLPRRMTEVSLDAPNSFNPYVQSGLLGLRHGVTREIQAGLRYGTGTLYDGEYFAGKSFSVDGEYRVFDWLAAQLSVPMLVDPYSVGVTIGAPMKFSMLGRLRFDLFRDFITFKVSRFAPSVVDAAFNDRQVEADRTNSVIEDGHLALNAGATWQLQPQMAIEARLGITGPDFEFQSDSPTAFDLGLIYSGASTLDIGGRLGFADLNHPDESFGLWLLAALRI